MTLLILALLFGAGAVGVNFAIKAITVDMDATNCKKLTFFIWMIYAAIAAVTIFVNL